MREDDTVRIFHVFEDAESLDLLAVLEEAFLGADLVREDCDVVFLDDIGSEVSDGFSCDDDALTLLRAAHPGDGFLGNLTSVAGDMDDLLRKEVVELILERITANRLCGPKE